MSWAWPASMYFFISVAGASPVSLILSSAPGLLQRAGGGGQADAGGDDDALEVGKGLRQRQRLLLVDLLALLAVGDLHQLHLGELGFVPSFAFM